MKLTVEDLSITLDKKEVLKNICLKLESHELVMILGLNGAGKTTLLKAMVGLIQPNSGNIYYNNENLNNVSLKQRAKLISYIPQIGEKPMRYTIADFVLTGSTPYLDIFEVPNKSYEKKVIKALKEFDIYYLKNKFMDSISGGERQLVYLARAMVQDTPLMVLDEPTASLDYKRQHEFLSQLKQFIGNSSKGAILSVHDPNLALKYADKVIVIHNNTVFKRLKRKNGRFEEQLIEALNEVYSNRIKLIKTEDSFVLNWKEE